VIDESLRAELLSMREEDLRTRARLADDGSLFQGYHPEMEAVHRRNATRLAAIVERHGWPGRSLAGEDGADAAWMIAQHAIAEPERMRRWLPLVVAAAARGEADPVQAAMMEDRVRALEGRGQLYGTQLDWDESGELTPLPIEDREGVDERRRRLGLPPMAESVARHRAGLEARDRPLGDSAARRRESESWARRVGWRK
jgi:hypothetical protein